MNNWKRIKSNLLKDKEVKREYDNLALEYELIDKIVSLRRDKKISQKMLASKMKTTQSALSRFESGGISPTVGFLKRLAEALDVNLNIDFN